MVRNTVADRMLRTNKTDWIQRFVERKEKAKKEEAAAEAEDYTTSSRTENTRPSHVAHEYAGNYSHPGYGEFDITVENDSLFANFVLMKFYLKHQHYDIFEPFEVTETGIDTSDTGALRFNFATNDAGDISLVKMKAEAALDPIEFKHAPNTIDVDTETLKRYVGDFELAETPIKVYIKNENTLYLFVAGQPEYELSATGKHKFSFKTLEGYKVEFIESDDKSINVMTLIQPNGTFKTTRK